MRLIEVKKMYIADLVFVGNFENRHKIINLSV